ncbi:hypothetical protein [Janthinobacterium psychrotolerans]|uniref:hypothetical protein n=2 Tax=Janthinobacterium TaxID=29580 RepID=UPI000806723C|nr:hypothetical protein [Janthinobacterium psychrotolerans]
MAFFSFRAECPTDVTEFMSACAAAGVTTSLTAQPDGEFPDVEVELEASVDLNTLRDVIRAIIDGHVMLQTLKECRLKDNTLERDYELE